MTDIFRVVELDRNNRPVEVMNLNDGVSYARERGTFKFTPGASNAQSVRNSRRYGGSRMVGMTNDNGTISWTALVKGLSAPAAAFNVAQIIAEVESAAPGRRIEWRAEGASYSSYFRIVGPGTWDPNYQWAEWATGSFMRTVVSFPVAPLVDYDAMDVWDEFDTNSSADYSYDSGSGDITFNTAGGRLDPLANNTVEKRLLHIGRGYSYDLPQVTINFSPGATITSFKLGAIIRRTASNTYLEAYVDDNGTNSRLRVDEITSGARVNKATVNLGARLVAGTQYWLRARTVATAPLTAASVEAELFTAEPSMSTTPTATVTGVSSGAINTGTAGLSWIPQASGAQVLSLRIQPFAKRAGSWPASTWIGDVPGEAPAEVDATVTADIAVASANWGMLSWAPYSAKNTALGSLYPFGVLAITDRSGATNWTLSGSQLTDVAVAGAENYSVSWDIDPSPLLSDDFADSEVTVEVWATVVLTSTLVSPRFKAYVSSGVSGLGTPRYTDEYGFTGRLITLPGPAVTPRRITRLGTITMPAALIRPRTLSLTVEASTAGGSTGTIGIENVLLVPSRSRACSPSGRAMDAYTPLFITGSGQTYKTVYSDLSGSIGAATSPTVAPYPDHGLAGSLLEVTPGPTRFFMKLSNLIPDDPSSNPTLGDPGSMTASLELAVRPRGFMIRAN